MGSIAAFLISMVGPIIKQVLISMGLAVVTYVGLSAAVDAVVANVQGSYASMSGVALQISDLLGIGSAMGIICGALVARITLAATTMIGKSTA